MNMIGKILIFLNLVLAVVFMTTSMFTYATHRNYRAEIEKKNGWKDQYNKAYDQVAKLTEERNQLQAQMVAEKIAAERSLAIAISAAKNSEKQLVARIAENQDQAAKLAALTQTNTKLQENLKLAADNERTARDTIVKILEDNKKRSALVLKLTDELNDLVAVVPNLKAMNAVAAQEYAKAKLLLEKFGYTPSDPIDLLPPPVDGRVVSVGKLQDPNLIELSMGSHDGLRLNHTVDLFKNDKYKGRAQIIEVKGDRAVAKIIKDGLKATIQEDDGFTTRLQYLTSSNK